MCNVCNRVVIELFYLSRLTEEFQDRYYHLLGHEVGQCSRFTEVCCIVQVQLSVGYIYGRKPSRGFHDGINDWRQKRQWARWTMQTCDRKQGLFEKYFIGCSSGKSTVNSECAFVVHMHNTRTRTQGVGFCHRVCDPISGLLRDSSQCRPWWINFVYPTRRQAECTTLLLRDHSLCPGLRSWCDHPTILNVMLTR